MKDNCFTESCCFSVKPKQMFKKKNNGRKRKLVDSCSMLSVFSQLILLNPAKSIFPSQGFWQIMPSSGNGPVIPQEEQRPQTAPLQQRLSGRTDASPRSRFCPLAAQGPGRLCSPPMMRSEGQMKFTLKGDRRPRGGAGENASL